MKKIIKHGYRYYMETTCPSCGCVFSYEEEDIITPYIWTSNTADNTVKLSTGTIGNQISCPECHTVFVIYSYPTWKYPKITCRTDKGGIIG